MIDTPKKEDWTEFWMYFWLIILGLLIVGFTHLFIEPHLPNPRVTDAQQEQYFCDGWKKGMSKVEGASTSEVTSYCSKFLWL